MDSLIGLIEFRVRLIELLSLLDHDPATNNISTLKSILTETPNQDNYISSINQSIDDCYNINSNTHKIVNDLKTLITTVEFDIDALANRTVNSEASQNNFKYDNPRVQATRTREDWIPQDPILKSIISAKLSLYSQFYYPGLIVGCQLREWVDLLVASDPLYLTNYNVKELFKEVILDYPEQYQRRVRPYQIIDQDYKQLPQEQFSVVFSWDYFNFINQKEVDRCLEEIFKLLRPGGGFIFNYNNCDLPRGMLQADNNFMSWNTRRHVQHICEKIGYDIVSFTDYQIDDLTFGHISWVELRKPGELKTIKLQQVMGAIGQK
jgi:hypothetical protein